MFGGWVAHAQRSLAEQRAIAAQATQEL
eukprot:SAG25_NODE_13886_length_261_cov_1.271605_1_plen_27_part_01